MTREQAPRPRVLVVFDYDLSLVDENSDLFVLQQVCPELLGELAALMQSVESPTTPGLGDVILGELAKRRPNTTRDEILQKMAQIPISPKMLDAVKFAVDQHDATAMIVSDANDLFIRSMLDHHGISRYFAEVHTNPAEWEDAPNSTSNRLRLRPYHPLESEPHGCVWCPTNMCKGRILDKIRSQADYDRVLYVGDGIGDFCPATRLTSGDIVFARADGPGGESYGMLERIKKHSDLVQARVVPWSSGEDIYRHFREALDESPQ